MGTKRVFVVSALPLSHWVWWSNTEIGERIDGALMPVLSCLPANSSTTKAVICANASSGNSRNFPRHSPTPNLP